MSILLLCFLKTINRFNVTGINVERLLHCVNGNRISLTCELNIGRGRHGLRPSDPPELASGGDQGAPTTTIFFTRLTALG